MTNKWKFSFETEEIPTNLNTLINRIDVNIDMYYLAEVESFINENTGKAETKMIFKLK